jgi:anti-anti-sigma factor
MILQKKLDEKTWMINPGKILDNNNAHEIADAISTAQSGDYQYIILDMKELEFLSSAGVGSILGSVEISRDKGGDIVLRNVPEKILHVLEVLDLLDYLTISSNEKNVEELNITEG